MEIDEHVLPQEHDVVVGTERLHYLDWPADPGAPAVVLLHGSGLTAHTWDLVCLALRPEYHCFAVDQRGHGDSSWSHTCDYSRDAHVGDLEQLVDRIGLEQFVLIGMSLGGLNAIEYAARHSGCLQALVLVDVGPEVRASDAGRIREFLETEVEFASVDEAVEHALAFNARRVPDLLRVSLLHNLRQLPTGRWAWKYDRHAVVTASVEEIDAEIATLAARIPQIACPTLVVRGAESEIFSEEQAVRLVGRMWNGRLATIEKAGHTVQGDNPAALVEALLQFFEAIRVKPSASAVRATARRLSGGPRTDAS